MSVSDINWVTVGRGRLALWHKPGRRAIPGLKRHGCEHVVTLLSAHEDAEEVGQAVRNAGMDRSWIPLPSGRPLQGRQNAPIVEARHDSRRSSTRAGRCSFTARPGCIGRG